MRLKYNPFPIIFSRGDDATQLACLEFFGQEKSRRALACLSALISQQRSDGGFASLLAPEHWGMQETVRNPLLFLQVGVSPEDSHVQNAIKFLLRQQRKDGGWCENPMLKIRLEQTWLSNQQSVTWLTANIVELLRAAGMSDRRECQSAVSWLKSIQDQDGSWPSLAPTENGYQTVPGDPDATAQITFLMGELMGENDPVYLKGRMQFERYLNNYVQDVERGYLIGVPAGEKGEIEVYHLTHLLLSSLLDPPRKFPRGYDVQDSRVKKMMDALVNIQREDGGWRPFWSQESSPVYTLLALKVLVLSGMLAQENLNHDVKAYVAQPESGDPT